MSSFRAFAAVVVSVVVRLPACCFGLLLRTAASDCCFGLLRSDRAARPERFDLRGRIAEFGHHFIR
ncbi:hypothetical protein, partial [Paraburkholderia sp. LEh10]|uniref:hypothetical protein n=1 Tax=Paraburkholderia sp. LEh10 TaxID=2821353 RepID=UPI001AE75C13